MDSWYEFILLVLFLIALMALAAHLDKKNNGKNWK